MCVCITLFPAAAHSRFGWEGWKLWSIKAPLPHRNLLFRPGALFFLFFKLKRKFPSLDFFRAPSFLIIHYLFACETDRQLDSKIQQTECRPALYAMSSGKCVCVCDWLRKWINYFEDILRHRVESRQQIRFPRSDDSSISDGTGGYTKKRIDPLCRDIQLLYILYTRLPLFSCTKFLPLFLFFVKHF
jgi:hypothetical protein